MVHMQFAFTRPEAVASLASMLRLYSCNPARLLPGRRSMEAVVGHPDEDTPATPAGEDSGGNGCNSGVSRRIIQIRPIHVEQNLAIATATLLTEKLKGAGNIDSTELGQHRFRIAVL
jgi:hypothetical protein